MSACALAVLVGACSGSQDFRTPDASMDAPGGDAASDGVVVDGVTCGAPRTAVRTPMCDHATSSCYLLCTSAMCRAACLAAADACLACLQDNAAACADANGCHDEYVAWDCCLAVNCPGTPSRECLSNACKPAVSALMTCYDAHVAHASPQPACAADQGWCLMP